VKRHQTSAMIFTFGAALVTAGFAVISLTTAGLVSGTPHQQIETFEDFACLDCHSDQDRLTELAVVEEKEAESLSSGPG
jgi:hypothetical protein